MSSEAIHLPTENRTFYHGTSKHSARSILHQGFRDWSWTENSYRFRYRKKEGADRHKHGGAFGYGSSQHMAVLGLIGQYRLQTGRIVHQGFRDIPHDLAAPVVRKLWRPIQLRDLSAEGFLQNAF